MCKAIVKILIALDNSNLSKEGKTGFKGIIKEGWKNGWKKKVLHGEHVITVKLKWMYAVCITADSAQQ